jgi:hypothetical protein
MPRPARADDAGAAAKKQFEEGMTAFQAKHYEEAALAFEAAASHKPHPVATYTAALAWERASRPERAADDYARSLVGESSAPGGLPDMRLGSEDAERARAALDRLERVLGTVVLLEPAGATATIDDSAEAPLPARLHALPGNHRLKLRTPNAHARSMTIKLEAGRTTTLAFETDTATSETATPSPTANSSPPLAAPRGAVSVRQRVGYGLIGSGVAAFLGSAVLWSLAEDAKSSFIAQPTDTTYDHARRLETWTNVAWISGTALALGGAALAFWPAGASSPVTATVAPTGFDLRGTF